VPEQAKQVADAAVEGRFASAHRALVADGSIQFDLPVFTLPKPPAWLEPVARFFKWLSPAYPYLFWGAIALAVLAIIYLVVSNIDGFEWPWRKRRATEAVEDSWRPEESTARALLADAEALAAQGRYAEAARLLLQRSVEDIARRLPEFLKPSLTARDISGAEALPGAARPAFAAIARVVEVSAFGSRAVTADAWEQCRAAYARFALPESWQRG
jgi:hypothetical protein